MSVRRLVPVRRAAASRPPAALPELALPPLTASRARATFLDERGAATAEYAIATMAAVAFAGLLVLIMRSDEVRGILTDLVRRALTVQ
ncbi:DUF4244 domain-containing protein [Microbacterium enclense]|uniref:DUF4244 domain-containing protein n=1 Tax=Microbacterium enclense TaxID=993073 RepID=UPI0036D977DE